MSDNYVERERRFLSFRDDIRRGDAVAVFWTVDDVLGIASQFEDDVTEEQARAALHWAWVKHDPCEGINWDVLEYWLVEVLAGNVD